MFCKFLLFFFIKNNVNRRKFDLRRQQRITDDEDHLVPEPHPVPRTSSRARTSQTRRTSTRTHQDGNWNAINQFRKMAKKKRMVTYIKNAAFYRILNRLTYFFMKIIQQIYKKHSFL